MASVMKFGGVGDVMIIVEVNGSDESSSNPG